MNGKPSTPPTGDPVPSNAYVSATFGPQNKKVVITVQNEGDMPTVATNRYPWPFSTDSDLAVNIKIGAYTVSGDWPAGGDPSYTVTP